jgi:hypothetical protein
MELKLLASSQRSDKRNNSAFFLYFTMIKYATTVHNLAVCAPYLISHLLVEGAAVCGLLRIRILIIGLNLVVRLA